MSKKPHVEAVFWWKVLIFLTDWCIMDIKKQCALFCGAKSWRLFVEVEQ